jgi:excinuclease ABC subunit C
VQQYDQRFALARAFLDGADDRPMESLRCDMEAASERLEYERAGALRDKMKRLEALRAQFGRLRFAVETLSFVYNVPGHEGDDRVYLIRRGHVRAEAPIPTTPSEAAALLGKIDEVYTPVERVTGQIPTHEIDELLLLSSWFRRFPEELERTTAGRGNGITFERASA